MVYDPCTDKWPVAAQPNIGMYARWWWQGGGGRVSAQGSSAGDKLHPCRID